MHTNMQVHISNVNLTMVICKLTMLTMLVRLVLSVDWPCLSLPESWRSIILLLSSLLQSTVGSGTPVARHRSLTEPPSTATPPSDESSSFRMSGGMTTAKWPICKSNGCIKYRLCIKYVYKMAGSGERGEGQLTWPYVVCSNLKFINVSLKRWKSSACVHWHVTSTRSLLPAFYVESLLYKPTIAPRYHSVLLCTCMDLDWRKLLMNLLFKLN